MDVRDFICGIEKLDQNVSSDKKVDFSGKLRSTKIYIKKGSFAKWEVERLPMALGFYFESRVLAAKLIFLSIYWRGYIWKLLPKHIVNFIYLLVLVLFRLN